MEIVEAAARGATKAASKSRPSPSEDALGFLQGQSDLTHSSPSTITDLSKGPSDLQRTDGKRFNLDEVSSRIGLHHEGAEGGPSKQLPNKRPQRSLAFKKPDFSISAGELDNLASEKGLGTKSETPSNPAPSATQAESPKSPPSHPAPANQLSSQNPPIHQDFTNKPSGQNLPIHQDFTNKPSGQNPTLHQDIANRNLIPKESLSRQTSVNQAESSSNVLSHQAESSKNAASHPMPQSLAAYKKEDGVQMWESFSDRFSFEPEPAKYERFYLDVTHQKVPTPINPADLAKSTEQIQSAGDILANLSGEERLRQTVDIDFVVREFRNKWIKKLHPEARHNEEALQQIDRVGKKLKQILIVSKKQVKAEQEIKEILSPWKTFERELGVALHDSMRVFMKEETDKVVMSRLVDRFNAWNPTTVEPVAKSVADNLMKNINYKELQQLYQVAFPARAKVSIGLKTLDPQTKDYRKYLVTKFCEAPQFSDEEFRFIFERISSRNFAVLDRKPDRELMDLTPETIATSIQVTPEDIMHLKFQFAMTRPLEETATQSAKVKLNSEFGRITSNNALMRKAYSEKLKEIIYHTSSKVEREFFQQNFGIQSSSHGIYYEMKRLSNMWNVDLRAFERTFKSQLPPEEYKELFKAATRSRVFYEEVLESIKESRQIDKFQHTEYETFELEHHATNQDAVHAFVVKLRARGIISDEFSDQLLFGIARPDLVRSRLTQMMEIGLFDKLEAGLVPQADLSPVTTSITNYLDKLTTKGLLTTEEHNYLYPLDAPKGLPPLQLIQDFSTKLNELDKLPDAFQNRLIQSLEAKFATIPRDGRFQSETLTRSTENLISSHSSDIKRHLGKLEYNEAFASLKVFQPKYVDNYVSELEEDFAKDLWNDYFSRNYRTYKTFPIDKEKDQIGGPEKRKIANPTQLIERALDHLAKDRPKITGSDQADLTKPRTCKLLQSVSEAAGGSKAPKEGKSGSTAGKGKLTPATSELAPGTSNLEVAKDPKKINKVTEREKKLPDERHYALWANPLKPVKENRSPQSLTLADERLKDTPFRYLKKEIAEQWNTQARFVLVNTDAAVQKIYKKDSLAYTLEKGLTSLDQYNQVVGKVMQQVNAKFSTIGSRGRALYKLTPKASDLRVQNSFSDSSSFSGSSSFSEPKQ
ncbi:uncharacterized protein PGTG_09444 [Puccinia graminis f. sp. tritici CRL 75-36-700-3]|uniref:Uncharacterized protein n=1 Tax=Puccinia graminis f. sp. tritici (strain CRL 75-36-700-3 / race SCCL) TaxID=418459 RepID=E3KHF6_PUCGT|nr:uncharacterized protein PGTG_09444 [Puccinia graminis f. sp. tritici CRL 75-36-700-3]EFP83731.2 hypothetical protein PGTG_09444 [Puccinia graminis f. sp. tritici CRL 75-36-700-3]